MLIEGRIEQQMNTCPESALRKHQTPEINLTFTVASLRAGLCTRQSWKTRLSTRVASGVQLPLCKMGTRTGKWLALSPEVRGADSD